MDGFQHAYEAYAPDTHVEDDPDAPEPLSSIAIGRAPSEELVVQAFLLGQWHRKLADLDETACAFPFHLSGTKTRREQLTHRDGSLCPLCFTTRELRRASENDRRIEDAEKHRAQRENIESLFKQLNEEE